MEDFRLSEPGASINKNDPSQLARIAQLEEQLEDAYKQVKFLEDVIADLERKYASLLKYAEVRDAKQEGIINTTWNNVRTFFGLVKTHHPTLPTPEKSILSPFRHERSGVQTPRFSY